jgi:(p)ppGpp synthase/HD superfamily hydrolase
LTREREDFNNWGVTLGNAGETKRKLVFTPKEELVFLEPEAKGVDVAYKLNPLLGMRAVAIKIDGKVCGLDAVIPNTSVVEIIVDPNKKSPEAEWLDYGNLETRRMVEKQLMMTDRDQLIGVKGI